MCKGSGKQLKKQAKMIKKVKKHAITFAVSGKSSIFA
jgi:hypothetical protein